MNGDQERHSEFVITNRSQTCESCAVPHDSNVLYHMTCVHSPGTVSATTSVLRSAVTKFAGNSPSPREFDPFHQFWSLQHGHKDTYFQHTAECSEQETGVRYLHEMTKCLVGISE